MGCGQSTPADNSDGKEPGPKKTPQSISQPPTQKSEQAAPAAPAEKKVVPPKKPAPPKPLKVAGDDDHDLNGEMVAIVSASRDKTLRVRRLRDAAWHPVWRMHDGHSVHHLLGHINKVAAVCALGNGKVVSGSEDGDVKIWNVVTGLCEKTITTNGNILSMKLAFGGKGVVTGHGSSQDVKNGVQLWEFDKPTERIWGVEALPSIVQAVDFVSGCDVVASAGNDHIVRLWAGATGESRATLEGHSSWIRCLAAMPGSRLASGSDDGSVRVWDAAKGALLFVLEQAHGGSNMFGLCALPDGRLATAGGDKCLRLWKPAEGDAPGLEAVAEYPGHASAVYAVAIAEMPRADGAGTQTILVSGGHDTSVRVWDVESKACSASMDDHLGWVLNVAVAPLTF